MPDIEDVLEDAQREIKSIGDNFNGESVFPCSRAELTQAQLKVDRSITKINVVSPSRVTTVHKWW